MVKLSSKAGNFAVYLKDGTVLTIYQNQSVEVSDDTYTSDDAFSTPVFKAWVEQGLVSVVEESPQPAKADKRKGE